jgi:nucleoid DNA-binding protein
MSLSTISDTIYEATDRAITRKQARAAAQAVIDSFEATLAAGDRIVLPGILSLKADFTERRRVVHLPTVSKNGEGVETVSRPKVKVTTSGGFRDKLAGGAK